MSTTTLATTTAGEHAVQLPGEHEEPAAPHTPAAAAPISTAPTSTAPEVAEAEVAEADVAAAEVAAAGVEGREIGGPDVADSAAAGEVQERARKAYRDSVAAGDPLNSRVLGERFERSERWGRDRIAEARRTLPGAARRRAARRGTRRSTATRTAAAPAADGNSSGSAAEGSAAAAAGAAPAAGGPADRAAAEPSAAATPAAVAEDERQPQGSAAEVSAVEVSALSGGRFVAWLGFVFGSVMSVAANVLHTWLPAAHEAPGWTPGIAPQIGSAVWPIGLLLSVEVLSRVRWAPGWQWALARYGGAGTVALGSAVISYGHLHEVLLAWNYGRLGAAVGPLVLDGLMVVSGFALLAMSQRQEGA